MSLIMITGSTGMVGRNLVSALKKHKDISLITPSLNELNLLNPLAVNQYIAAYQPQLIIHLAAKVGGIQANINYPVDFLMENLCIGTNLIKAAYQNQIKRLINISSASIYQCKNLLQDDNKPLIKDNEAYALAKLTTTKLCQYVCQQYGFTYKTIIPCNLYGPYDNFDLKTGHMIPAVIHRTHLAKQHNNPEIDIWGDGQSRREFMFVDDLISFIQLAIENIEALPHTTNIGLGMDFTIEEYYRQIANVIEYKGHFNYDLTKPTGQTRTVLDCSKAHALGWRAKTTLVDGIAKTYSYFMKVVSI